MRAAILKGGEIEIGELPDPTPKQGQVLVSPLFNGICGSDLHFREAMNQITAQTPPEQRGALPAFVPGHEFSAEVLEIGPATETDLRPGDRIVPIPFVMTDHGAETVGLSSTFSGGLATRSVVIADRCFRIPRGVAADLAALTEPLSVGRHATNLAHRNRGPNVIIGCGPVGLAVLLALKAEGRGPVLAADFSAERRALAEALGADIVVDPSRDAPYAHWNDLGFTPAPTSPLLQRNLAQQPPGVNIFECVGAPGLLDQVIKNAPMHSHVIVVGVCAHVDHHTPLDAIVRELTVEYSFAYRPDEFEASLRLMEDEPERVARLITSRRPLAETPLAFDALSSSPREVKILINPRA
ncbi:MAG: zinc-binding dehydrogenase [Terricaulis sp.]